MAAFDPFRMVAGRSARLESRRSGRRIVGSYAPSRSFSRMKGAPKAAAVAADLNGDGGEKARASIGGRIG
jgi:hypothetical protein